MREFQHTVTTPDGIKLLVRESLPETSPATRNVLFVHGACEHGGRYREFTQAATAVGWRVLIPDHRGHGLSTGVRVHVRHFNEYLDDLRLICRHFTLDPARTAVVGHSMGGLVVARLLESGEPPFRAGCLLSPYLKLRIQVDSLTLWIGGLLAAIWPRFRFRSRVRAGDLSPDQQYLEQRRQDYLIQRGVTAGWFFATCHAQQAAVTDAPRIQLPLLVLQGDQDRVVDPSATAEWLPLTGSADRTLVMLPGHLHELLQELDRHQTIQYILDWLQSRVPVC